MIAGGGDKGGHRRGVSETEFLLNQIRSNINTLKAYQQQYPEMSETLEAASEPAYNFINKPQKPQNSAVAGYQRVTQQDDQALKNITQQA